MQTESKIPCTVYVMTLNGEEVLARALESLVEFGEVIVCDGNSTDRTLEIARQFGARIIKQVDSDQSYIPLQDFAAVQNKCIKAAQYDWIFQMDMDETLSPELIADIRRITGEPLVWYAFNIPQRIMYKDRIITRTTGKLGYEMKFFNRKSGCISVRTPHHRLEFDEVKYPVGFLKSPYVVHYWIPPYNEGKQYSKRFMEVEIKELRKQSWPQFFYWTIVIRSLKIVKKFFQFFLLYIRYGFKDTYPPHIEFSRVQYAVLILVGALKERINGRYKIRES